MKVEGAFDWRGFGYFLRVVGLCLLVGVGLYGVLLSAVPQTPAPTLAVVNSPAGGAASPALGNISARTVGQLRIKDVVPAEGKFIGADLHAMEITLYKDGALVARYPIKTKGRAGTPWETPSGFYAIHTKERNHFSTIGKVFMPYSMQFYGNYFIHGWTYYPDGTPTNASFSGGCIKLDTEDARAVFEFADIGTRVFVEDEPDAALPPLVLQEAPKPPLGAGAYLVADVDTGHVYAESRAQELLPVFAATKLMTALVANEIISFDKQISLPEGQLSNPPEAWRLAPRTFAIGDLLYPLLMQSNDRVAEALASYYGKHGFVRWMNMTAKALNMSSSNFVDASGESPDNRSTPEDLFRLTAYLARKKSFVLSIAGLPQKSIAAEDGTRYTIEHRGDDTNTPALSVVDLQAGSASRRAAIVVFGSPDKQADVEKLSGWIRTAAISEAPQTACAACATPQYRKIEL